MSHINVFFNTK